MSTIQVAIVDDHPLLRIALCDVIDRQPDMAIVGEAADGLEALRITEAHSPDVVLLDLILPDLDGVTVIERLRAREGRERILALTGVPDVERAIAAAQHGASGYLLKTCQPGELIHAIREVAHGREYWPDPVSTWLARSLREAYGQQWDDLTPRESEVLSLLGRGYSNRRIADQLSIAESTARVHVHRILTKLNLENRTQAAILARERSA